MSIINGHFRNLNWRYLPYKRPIFAGLCKGIYHQNMAKHMVLTYLHVLDPGDLPLISWLIRQIIGHNTGDGAMDNHDHKSVTFRHDRMAKVYIVQEYSLYMLRTKTKGIAIAINPIKLINCKSSTSHEDLFISGIFTISCQQHNTKSISL